eukprot:TRINITY_DN64339_c0_g1_i2.p1 TRINITY_DN64339_c0_g1~~TRINITY_DN64339_c0_g1_i2.p1  ORF type:complete len:1027 (-),score=129.24 TRINITY_DN64339_c0_g1_i2:148-3228(-)
MLRFRPRVSPLNLLLGSSRPVRPFCTVETEAEEVEEVPVVAPTPTPTPPPIRDEELLAESESKDVTAIQLVKNFLRRDGTYEAQFFDKEVDYYFSKLQLAQTYFYNYGPRRIASHILSLISAKTLSEMAGDPHNIESFVEGDQHALYWTTVTPEATRKIEKRVVEYIRETPSDMGFSVSYFRSGGPIAENIPYPLGLYSVNRSKFNRTKKADEEITTSNIQHIATQEFLASKSTFVRDRYQRILDAKSNYLPPYVMMEDDPFGSKIVMIAYNKSHRNMSYIMGLCELLNTTPMKLTRMYVEKFLNGVQVYTFYLADHTPQAIEKFCDGARMLSLLPNENLSQMLYSGKWDTQQLLYAHSATMFAFYFLGGSHEEYRMLKEALANKPEPLGALKGLRSTMRREGMSEEQIYGVLMEYPDLVEELFEDFTQRMKSTSQYKVGEPNTQLQNSIMERVHSVYEMHVLRAFIKFNAHVLKTNFYKPSISAVSYRLHPGFLKDSDYPELPYGLFMLTGSEFNGFHIRFREIARGGIRMIRPRPQQFTKTKEFLFDETYNLAHTQQLKNKDIPEGGSKGSLLVTGGQSAHGGPAFKKYIDAFLDVLLPGTTGVVDLLGKEELVFFGPDEGTADLMDWAAIHSKKRGYGIWKALTTGKSVALGGIPHDTYGMTTNSVHTMVLGVLDEMGLKEEEITKFQTGGPDGDLGSNEIIISKDKTIAIVDKSGVIYDPAGLNRDELMRLAKSRKDISTFDITCLGQGGFKVLVGDTNIKLPTGEFVESGEIFSNNFHLHPLSTADLFVPCGGRPESVNVKNMGQCFDEKGNFKWKMVVEGANLFVSQPCRLKLEKEHGVFLIKDACANKGGVTSSSLEVLSGLALNDEEHHQLMCAPGKVPQLSKFYANYVEDVLKVIKENARMEFKAMSREVQAAKKVGQTATRTELTDVISGKINYLTDSIYQSDLAKDQRLFHSVLIRALPPLLLKHVPLHTIVERVPLPYLTSIFSTYLASHYVYEHGLRGSEFTFWEYVNNIKRG